MKKFIFLLTFSFLTMGITNAQSFTLTPNGLVDSNDETKDYVVIEMEGSQVELYRKVKNTLYGLYHSPKEVLSEAEPDMITISAYQNKAIRDGMWNFNLQYSMSIRFKDGRVRVDSPSLTMTYPAIGVNGKVRKLLVCGTANGGLGEYITTVIYSEKNGKLKSETAKQDVESFFNALLTSIKNSNDVSTEDDW